MSKLSEADTDEMVLNNVRAITRALPSGPAMRTPEIMATQHYACLLAGAGIWLRAAGYRPWTPGGDRLLNEMAVAAYDAMQATIDRARAARN